MDKFNVENHSEIGFGILGIILWIIAFTGEPDLIDAIIYFLMK